MKHDISSVMENSFHCVLCNSKDSQLLHLVPGHYSEEIYKVVVCSSCGMIQVYPRPSKHYLKSFYDSHFDADVVTTSPYRIFVFEKILTQIKKRFPKPASLLDVGCGNGSFLETAKKFSRNVCGVDTSAYCCRTCKEKSLTVYCGELEEVNFPNSSFDVVTMFHVIEHVLDPRSLLVEVRRILKVGGGVVVRTPNVDSKISKATGPYWGWMNPPFHLNYFSPSSLSKILENTGFSVDLITTRFSPEYNKNFFTELLFSMYRRLTTKMKHGTYSKESVGRKVHSRLTEGPIKRVLTTPTFLDGDKEIVAFACKLTT
ncbi:MAG: class I SAM-dependent methyltransferase [Promethearchaeota archaeon]